MRQITNSLNSTALYSIATDLCGATAVVPTYLGLEAIKNAGPVANIMVGRPIRPDAVRSLIPAAILSFAIAAAAVWLAAPTQDRTTLWRLAPLLIALVTQVFYSWTRDEQILRNDRKGFEDVNNTDLPALKMVYGAVTAALAAAHLGLVLFPWLSGSLGSRSLVNMFASRETFVLAGSLAGGAVVSIVDTRLQGYVTTWSAIRTGLISLISLPIFGPAAVFTSVRYWKEVTTAKFCFWKHEKDASKA